MADGGITFKGVQIEPYSSDMDGARRVQLEELPFSESVRTIDLGREASKISVRGFVLGPDLQTKQKALVMALGSPSPGELVHPQFGKIRAICAKWALGLKHDAQGLIDVTAQFVRADEYKSDRKDSYSADDKIEDVKNLTADLPIVTRGPSEIFESMLGDVTSGIKRLDAAVQKFIAPGNLARSTAQRISTITEKISSIIKSPGALAEEYNLLTTSILSDLDAVSGRNVSRSMIDNYKRIGIAVSTSRFEAIQSSNQAAHAQIICMSFAPTLLAFLSRNDSAGTDDILYFSQSTEEISENLEDAVIFSRFEVFRSKSRTILASSRVLKNEQLVYDDLLECYQKTGNLQAYSSIEEAKPLRLPV